MGLLCTSSLLQDVLLKDVEVHVQLHLCWCVVLLTPVVLVGLFSLLIAFVGCIVTFCGSLLGCVFVANCRCSVSGNVVPFLICGCALFGSSIV